MGWDEILEGGLAPNAMVMSWRGEKGGIEAAQQNHDVVMTPGNPVYFDHTQSENEDSVTIGGFNPIEKVYAYEPIPAALNEEQSKHVLGAQANMWTEYMKNTMKVEYMLFPRMAALSEVLWSKKENKNWIDFEKRLQKQFKRYELWKANFSKAYFDLKVSVMPTNNFDGILLKVESRNAADSIFYIQHSALPKAIPYTAPIQINNSSTKEIIKVINQKTVSKFSQQFYFNKATGKKITLEKQASKSYPGDGPFTLVNGVQNTKGMSKTKEFLGFSGEDCMATIDLGKEESSPF
jgi:hexosaminidase